MAKALASGIGAPTVAHRDEDRKEMNILTGTDAGAGNTGASMSTLMSPDRWLRLSPEIWGNCRWVLCTYKIY